MNAQLPKGSRITGEGRNDLSASLAARYNRGESIRSMADDIGRSYGFVHGVLVEAGVTMRSRGGATRGAAAEARRAAAKKVNA
ncbi:helix-turn-helix domain-containing protein [Cellulomonas sp. KRMCY2]|uniref:helix-turn-helix domain-containing protein n=1 Tax=Cellulomonas sp. KRMCY2 TaxID=1304865 RepID=UPI00045EBAA1|nr:helix-turn-helix domain-containing protein [Cellulomonas sp. KRMCY2]